MHQEHLPRVKLHQTTLKQQSTPSFSCENITNRRRRFQNVENIKATRCMRERGLLACYNLALTASPGSKWWPKEYWSWKNTDHGGIKWRKICTPVSQGQSICKPSSETAMCTCRYIECSMPAPSTENHVFAATQQKWQAIGENWFTSMLSPGRSSLL